MPNAKARSKVPASDGGMEDQADIPNDQANPHSSILDHSPDTTVNPYELMGLTREATEADIKRAYKKGALRWHPDKHPADQKHKAQKAFQQLTTAYAVLSDPMRRRHYDATGKIHDALHMNSDDPWSWQPFYQRCWAEMAEGDIEAFAKEYRFSEEERQDLLMQYTTHKGNMTKVYEHVTLSNPLEDDDRYRQWINDAIAKGDVESHKAFTKETARSIKSRKDEAKKEAAEAEEMKQILKQKGSWFDPPSDHESQDLLAVAIREKNKSKSAAFLDRLMAKYGGDSKKKNPKKDFSLLEEPSEEAFARNRKNGFEEALKRDEERRKAKAPARSLKRKVDDLAGQLSESDGEHPVTKWNKQRKKVKQQNQEDAAARAGDPSTDEEDGPGREDRDEEMYGEPKENAQLRATTASKSKATSTKKVTTKKPPASNTKSKSAAIPKARPKRSRRAIVETDEEEAGPITLGSRDSDEDDEYEG